VSQYTNHNFVLDIRSTRLSLTASLKSAQLSSNLLLMQSTVKGTSTRIAIQSALKRYYDGNNTVENWARTKDDLQAVFMKAGAGYLTVQARIYPLDPSIGPVVEDTADDLRSVRMPETRGDGTMATLDNTFLPELYPNFTTQRAAYNSTHDTTIGMFEGRRIQDASYVLCGPYFINDTLSLVSITMPIINNTSSIEVLGWLTSVLDAHLIVDVISAMEGLDNTGLTMLFGPNSTANKFPPGTLYNSLPEPTPADNELVKFVLPPTPRHGDKFDKRHDRYLAAQDALAFDWSLFPAVKRGFTHNTHQRNNAGSMISTVSEEKQSVAIGYAVIDSKLVDWILLVEQQHREVWAPIYRLRNIILACVFGTMGAMLALALPVAHYSSRPIRRLRDATKRSVSPHLFDDSDFGSSNQDGTDEDEHAAALARKEGFISKIVHYRRNHRQSKAERREAERRRQFRIPGKVKDRKHFIHDELTDLTKTFNEMTDELMMQYEKLEERVQQRTAELELSKKAAEAANESKTLFIANISHELKTPLNGILGMCAVCMSEDDPIKLKRSLGIIYKSGDLLLNLLTDLLTFSKNQVSANQLTLDEKEFRLRDISSQVLAIFERQAKDSGIDLGVKFEGPYEANVDENGRPIGRGDLAPFGLGRLKEMILYGDQHRILQVVINLVSNSLKFTPAGGSIVITIRCSGETEVSHSRKASLQSRNSRNSSARNSKSGRMRAASSEVGSMSHAPNQFETANSINAYDKHNTAFSRVYNERAPTPPPGRWLSFEFEVEDTGPGIPDHLHDKIFEPFVQGDLGLSKKYGGTGLGLSICSQLAGLMKGSITLKSEVGQGSVFTMAIPLKHLASRADSTASSSIYMGDGSLRASRTNSLQEARRSIGNDDARSSHSVQSASSSPLPASTGPVPFETDAKPRLVGLSQPFFASTAPLESPNSQAAAMQRVEAEATKRGDKVKVLVAEDNKTNQEVVLRMLKLEDVYDVTIAKDGQEALDMVKQSMERNTPYNLIFMDIQMPNLDGLQSTRLIRQSGFSAPIVALTAYSEESNIRECYDSGMDFFLSKPIRRPALKHVLKTYCAPIPEEDTESASTPPATEATSSKQLFAPSAPAPAAIPTHVIDGSQNSPSISPLTRPEQ
jgi:osomolarity two-component system sensor histidine kinase SLN1